MRKPVGWAMSAGSAVANAPWAIKAVGWAIYTAARVCLGVVLPC